MAMMFADDRIKCTKCGGVTFKKVDRYMYTKIKDRQGEALKEELCGQCLECTSCGKVQDNIDLAKTRIV